MTFAPETTEHVYDLVGRVDLMATPNGVVADYIYDTLGRVDELIHFVDTDDDFVLDAGEITLAHFDYTVRDDGQRTAAIEQFDTNSDGTLRYNGILWMVI